ncbi:MAG: cytochrome c biogenesis protein CcsA [Candidatus Omnitrophica bacterium]|nr:cytochrome c biogenesis protein CcsA [Candidatus Omnitrophota bacterium]
MNEKGRRVRRQGLRGVRWVAGAFALWCLLPRPLHAGEEPVRVPTEAVRTIRQMAIQHNGRHKPFESFARETVKFITGSDRIEGEEPVVSVLSIIATPEAWQPRPLIAVPFRPLREAIGLSAKTTHVSYEELVTTKRLMKMLPAIVAKQQQDEKLTMLEQETMDLFERFVAFSALVEHRLELVPAPSAGDPSWRSIQRPEGYSSATQAEITTAWSAWIMALRDGPPEVINATTTQLTRLLVRLNPSAYPPQWRLRLEVFYHRFNPFWAARIFYAIAILGLLVALFTVKSQAAVGGLVAFGFAAAWHLVGILMRVVIGGRPPVSNFYETMLWLPFVGVVLAFVFERIYRANVFALAASILATVTLWLSDTVPLDASIAPVVAVLRSNLWLTIHVLTIVASYGALALAVILAHLYGILVLRRMKPAELEALDLFLYRAIQVGVVLLAGGIMLGAVWANASWGRYWGWDPKETWALITLLWFLASLHGRFAGWLKGVGFALTTIAGFFLLLMTYYGVSFYLVGLHSYAGGHAKPLPPLLIVYGIAEFLFMALVALTAARRQRPA